MTYSKPEIAVLGDAAHVIETIHNKLSGTPDAPGSSGAAYDLDE